ncbi:hypothetical protein [Acinetobacter populi]|uniref:DNA-binding protein n=1 Tax=Acinetobacter populi TaxID=1582270 RepID=A0A1Z9Z2R3_9GAMM|nr:hypothetical protein [Acinetobacter populi]OUY08736.1 hypothetical protein CAP51_03735 [Acinetobacter populi]
MADLSQLEKIINKMVDRIAHRPTIPLDQQLWDEHDIAAYFGYSLDYTKKHIMNHKQFPPARMLPTKDTYVPRWKASDVTKYAMAFDKQTISY